jgi:hypothetical protein
MAAYDGRGVRCRTGAYPHLNQLHHTAIFVNQNVAVKYELGGIISLVHELCT